MSVSRNVLVPGAGVQAARALLLLPARALQTPLGRRVAVAGALVTALQGAVGVMYANAEDPKATAQRATPAALTRPAGAAGAAPHAKSTPQAKSKAKSTAAPASSPAAAAAAWYAERVKVDHDKVRVLQQQRLGADRVRVLVMAEVGRDRLDTALVTVRRQRSGWVVR